MRREQSVGEFKSASAVKRRTVEMIKYHSLICRYRTMNLGVCTISSKERSVSTIAEICGNLDIDGIELWGREHVGDGSPEACRTIAGVTAKHGLAIPVYGSYLRLGSSDFTKSMHSELVTAEALGADLIRVWAGEQEHQDCEEGHLEQVIADLRRLDDAAIDRGISVTVERHSGTVTNTTAGAEELISRTDSTNVGLNWQPYFEHDTEAIADDIERLAGLANNVHVQAVTAPGETKRVALADAYFDVSHIIDTLQNSGYDGYIEVELVTQRAPYQAALAADVTFLRTLLDSSL